MTRAEILDCLTDRPCEVCRFHESGKCARWDCVFEEKPDDCDDAISRAEAIEAIAKADCTDGTKVIFCGRFIVELLKELPSVTPKQKMGEWLCSDDIYEQAVCSLCKENLGEPFGYAKKYFKFCPHCGAKMAESEE